MDAEQAPGIGPRVDVCAVVARLPIRESERAILIILSCCWTYGNRERSLAPRIDHEHIYIRLPLG